MPEALKDGGRVMSILQNELRRVVAGMTQMEEDFELLKQDYGPRSGEVQTLHLANLSRVARELEFHLNIAILDCAASGRKYGKEYALPSMASLHWAFACMYDVFSRLKTITNTSGAKTGSRVSEVLDEDWEKFKRAVFMALKVAGQPVRRRKHLFSGKRNCGREREWRRMS